MPSPTLALVILIVIQSFPVETFSVKGHIVNILLCGPQMAWHALFHFNSCILFSLGFFFTQPFKIVKPSSSSLCVCVCMCVFVCVLDTQLSSFVTPWTVTHKAPLSMDFFRQEYRSVAISSSRDSSHPETEPRSPALREDSLPSEEAVCSRWP